MNTPKPSVSFGQWRKTVYRRNKWDVTTPACRQAQIGHELRITDDDKDNENVRSAQD